jgi:hypothetical protein
VADLIPGLQDGCASFDGRYASFNLDGPLAVRIGICRAVQTGEQFNSEFGASMLVEAQRVGQDGGNCLGHDEAILRLDGAPNKRLRPTAPDVVMSRRG